MVLCYCAHTHLRKWFIPQHNVFINPHNWSAGLTSGVARSFFQFWPWLGWMKGRRKLSNHSNVFLFCCWLVPYHPIPGSHLFDQVHVARLPDISLSSLKGFSLFTLESSPCWRSNTSRNLWETYRRYQRSPPPFEGSCFVNFVSLFRWLFSDSLDQVQVEFLGDCFGDGDDLA